ncbi:DeoR/GlpR family DNA-binding transcription regulator [Kocuria flava]|uniref:DeoR family transcriptional regulator n=1 Tax=Kocuria flava TaxID=446860 RepID=A0A2N4T096_9MICC|nr:DeoR/GlpR family DNA-binding transcription regulator [Kocuria flava]PLC11657.1 DeoR family transcriptional regulator [Kocuria flava]
MTMPAKIRRERIYDLARTSGLASVEELSARFEVTPSTIRRDLALLHDQGRLARTYGGAMPIDPHPEASLRQRIGEAFEAKKALARWAAEQVHTGEHVLLDGGSTVGALAHELRARTDLDVTTIGLNTLQELNGCPGVRLTCLGGQLRETSQSFYGPLTELGLARMTFDRVFLGADAVTAEHGICEADHLQTRLKELMAARSTHVYVLAHGEKVGARPFHAWAQLPLPWTLVTTADAPEGQLRLLRENGVTVVPADAGPARD